MPRIPTLTLAGVTALALTMGSLSAAQAAPLPALSSAQVGGNATVDRVGWRRGYWGGPRWGYGYRRPGIGGALAAGAALGLIGGAIAASSAPRYGYYDYGYPAYGYGYPAYGYTYPYSYGYPYAW